MRLYFAERFIKSLEVTPKAEFVFIAPVASTNAEFSADMAEFSCVVSDEQTAGRGRLDRVWSEQKGKSLAISVLLKPLSRNVSMEHLSWLPLIGGLAMCQALNDFAQKYFLTADPLFQVKWPNDVLHVASGKKVAGVLTVMQPNGDVIIGTGVNIAHSVEELPVETATSLKAVCDGKHSENPSVKTFNDSHFDGVLVAYLKNLHRLYEAFVRSGGDAVASGILAKVEENCFTLNQPVRVVVPGQPDMYGTATGLGASGQLLVEDGDGRVHPIFAGDITHLRHTSLPAAD